jgi:hypothetical protein
MQLIVPLMRMVVIGVGIAIFAAISAACSVYNDQVLVDESSSSANQRSRQDAACADNADGACEPLVADAAVLDSGACAEGATSPGCAAKNIDSSVDFIGRGADSAHADATVPAVDSTSPAGGGGASGVGGKSAAAGAGGASGAGGSGGSTTDSYSPLCTAVPQTAAGAAPVKDGACTASDTQLCYRTCGPQSIGYKTETCTNGKYVEQSGCTFPPSGDYTCYKIPGQIDATCPTTTPQSTKACSVNPCVLCNVKGNYLDSGGVSKTGYCVCPAATDASTSRAWSCASSTSWPCPGGNGC